MSEGMCQKTQDVISSLLSGKPLSPLARKGGDSSAAVSGHTPIKLIPPTPAYQNAGAMHVETPPPSSWAVHLSAVGTMTANHNEPCLLFAAREAQDIVTKGCERMADLRLIWLSGNR